MNLFYLTHLLGGRARPCPSKGGRTPHPPSVKPLYCNISCPTLKITHRACCTSTHTPPPAVPHKHNPQLQCHPASITTAPTVLPPRCRQSAKKALCGQLPQALPDVHGAHIHHAEPWRPPPHVLHGVLYCRPPLPVAGGVNCKPQSSPAAGQPTTKLRSAICASASRPPWRASLHHTAGAGRGGLVAPAGSIARGDVAGPPRGGGGGGGPTCSRQGGGAAGRAPAGGGGRQRVDDGGAIQ
jgi:hypothetical protein